MPGVEIALHQGPACALAKLKKRWPRLDVQVESLVVFEDGPVYETARLSGQDSAEALKDLEGSVGDRMVILGEDTQQTRLRLEIAGCPLRPLVGSGGIHPVLPFHVEADSDRWVVEDAPECLDRVFGALKQTGLMPKMIRRDPSRRR